MTVRWKVQAAFGGVHEAGQIHLDRIINSLLLVGGPCLDRFRPQFWTILGRIHSPRCDPFCSRLGHLLCIHAQRKALAQNVKGFLNSTLDSIFFQRYYTNWK
jgi:hypothetical protein